MSETIHIGDLVSDISRLGWVISEVDNAGFYLLEWSDGWKTRAISRVVNDYKYRAKKLLTG